MDIFHKYCITTKTHDTKKKTRIHPGYDYIAIKNLNVNKKKEEKIAHNRKQIDLNLFLLLNKKNGLPKYIEILFKRIFR